MSGVRVKVLSFKGKIQVNALLWLICENEEDDSTQIARKKRNRKHWSRIKEVPKFTYASKAYRALRGYVHIPVHTCLVAN